MIKSAKFVCAFLMNFVFRAKVHWNCRDINNMLKGYKMDLAAAVGSKLPAALLNFYFKHSFLRKVKIFN